MIRRRRHRKHKQVLQKLGYLALKLWWDIGEVSMEKVFFRMLTMVPAEKHYWRVPSYLTYSDVKPGYHTVNKLELLTTHQAGPTRIATCGLIFASTSGSLEFASCAGAQDSENSTSWMPDSTHEMGGRCFMDVANIRGLYNVKLTEAKARVNNYLSQKKAGAYLIASGYVDVTDTWTQGSGDAPPLTESLPQSEQGCIILCTEHPRLAMGLPLSDVIFLPPKPSPGD